eukprot:TRINITY_DN34740_c0_g1_i1.p1 TRINITY_DN34740_c0_g1~~TRINITY_DN34740_c0_g1_i1.p1  ORF type:complete len:365 (+),score=95.22 TRINITY_DN34740_c0_g1_i1:101-1195(+)
MAGSDMSGFGLKNTMMDSLKESGKAANISADSFVQQHTSLTTTVHSHESLIGTLSQKFTGLEQQVNAIVRVMASQNIQKMSENIKLSQEELQRTLMEYVNEKNRDIRTWVEREVSEVVDAKNGLGKKIDTVEAHVLTVMNSKLEEAQQMRYALKDELEKVQAMMEDVPNIADKNSKLLKQLETKHNELKNDFRKMEREMEQENMVQDKQVAALTAEIRAALEAAKDKLQEEAKGLSKSIRKHEAMIDDKMKGLSDMIEQESNDRIAATKAFPTLVSTSASNVKADLEKKITALEMDMDRKVRPVVSSVKEVRRLIDEETVHRDAADQSLSMRLAKEINDRNHDEARLVGLISTCQETVAKMHKI